MIAHGSIIEALGRFRARIKRHTQRFIIGERAFIRSSPKGYRGGAGTWTTQDEDFAEIPKVCRAVRSRQDRAILLSVSFGSRGGSFNEGIEMHKVDGIRPRIYRPEKMLADRFKYRNKIGLDAVLEALRLHRCRKRTKVDELLKFARVCRVEKVMRPYLEAVVYCE